MKISSRKIICTIFTVIICALLLAGCATGPSVTDSKKQASIIIKIEPRKGVVQQFVLIAPENPVASIILLPGNNGRLELSDLFGGISIGWLDKDFLVRNRDAFAKYGLMVALMDAPSDKQSGGRDVSGGVNVMTQRNEMFRMSNEHAQDIIAVAEHLKKMANIPVWLIGTSMGTISATNACIRSKGAIDGLVLTASKTQTTPEWGSLHNSHPNAIINMELQKILTPTLIVHHREDTCDSSSPEFVPKIKEGLTNAAKTEVVYFSGGKPASAGCHPSGAHAFYGIDHDVLRTITSFILSNLK